MMKLKAIDTDQAQYFMAVLFFLNAATTAWSDERIVTTSSHRFWVSHRDANSNERLGEWVEAEDLRAGDQFLTADGRTARLKEKKESATANSRSPAAESKNRKERKEAGSSLSPLPSVLSTFNLSIADHHTYFVGEQGLWVHNTCQDQLRTIRWGVAERGNVMRMEQFLFDDTAVGILRFRNVNWRLSFGRFVDPLNEAFRMAENRMIGLAVHGRYPQARLIVDLNDSLNHISKELTNLIPPQARPRMREVLLKRGYLPARAGHRQGRLRFVREFDFREGKDFKRLYRQTWAEGSDSIRMNLLEMRAQQIDPPSRLGGDGPELEDGFWESPDMP